MLNCENCVTQPVCKIFEEKKKFAPIASIYVDNCKCFNNKNSNFESGGDYDFEAINNRIEIIQKINESRNLTQKEEKEEKVCVSCNEKKDHCVKCDSCGNWVCPDCATTTLENKVLCMECYNDANYF